MSDQVEGNITRIEVREALEGLRNRRGCWCRELLTKPAFDYTVTESGVIENHDNDCHRVRALYDRIQART